MKALGLLSGTSADGVDAALVDLSHGGRDRIRLLLAKTFPYPAPLRERVLAAHDARTPEIAALHADLGDAFAAAAVKLLRAAGDKGIGRPSVIGSHGQTIYHLPGRASIQIGDASRIAHRTGIRVVSDFRAGDIAVGGSGAPLVPILDERLFGDLSGGTVSLNLGGIANVTHIANRRVRLGFDTGPANAPMDAAIRLSGRGGFDRNGLLAMAGRTDPALLAMLMEDSYFSRKPPKSLERETFGAALVKPLLDSHRLEDLVSTLTDLSAETIADAISRWCLPSQRLVISGGGAKNKCLLMRLARALDRRKVRLTIETSEAHGIHPDQKEAVLFALLAAMRMEEKEGNVPAATGARDRVVLGALHLPW